MSHMFLRMAGNPRDGRRSRPVAYVQSIGARTQMIVDPPLLYAVAALVSACGAALACVIWAVRRKP